MVVDGFLWEREELKNIFLGITFRTVDFYN